MAQNVIDCNKTLNLPSEIVNRLKGIIGYSNDRILQCVDIMSTVEANMRYSSMPRTLIEASIAKCADPKANVDLTGVVTRLKTVEDRLANGNFSANAEAFEVKKNKRAFSKSACCGFLIKATRDMKKFALYSELTELNKDNFSLDGKVVQIRPSRANMADILLLPEYFELIKKLVVDEFDDVDDIAVIQSDKIVNIDDDIAYVKGLFDKDIVKIK